MANEFIIKINKDRNGNDLSLTNMSLEAIEALHVFLTSLKDFAKLQENQNLRFTLRDGCIETAISYPEADEQIGDDINSILDGSSENNDFIRIFKSIQNKVQANGLDYSLTHKMNNVETDVTNIFKTKRFAYRRGPKKTWHQEVIFIDGVLIDNGGKVITNLHVETADAEYTIDSTREESKIVREFLYENVYLVAAKRYHDGEKPHYKFVDYYLSPEKFRQYKDFYQQINSDQTLAKYDKIYDTIMEIINGSGSINEVLKVMRLFNFSFTDRGIIRTILMALKPIDKTDNQKLKDLYDSLAKKLRETSTNNMI